MAADRRKDAFVMVYAVCTLVLVSSLSLSMVDSTGSDLEIARLRMSQVLARVSAESGIDFALAVVTRELGRKPNLFVSPIEPGGPWNDVAYDVPTQKYADLRWFAALHANTFSSLAAVPPDARQGITKLESLSEAPPVRLHQLQPGNSSLTPGNVLIQGSQFQVALAPTPNYTTVRLATINGNPTVFWIRSRGEILFNRTPGVGTNVVVLGSAYATQTFVVLRPDSSAPCEMPRPTRMVFDREPISLTNKGVRLPNPH